MVTKTSASKGVGVLTQPPAPQAGPDLIPGSWLRQAAKGLGVSGLNPKVFLLFLALHDHPSARGSRETRSKE
jgi:hypothetical protein